MQVERYTPQLGSTWDAFVAASRNGTFLLSRPYMDYHAARFADVSLLFRNDRGRTCGVLPANYESAGGAVWSHEGLTYGGLVLAPATSYGEVAQMLDLACRTYAQMGAERLMYKPIPHIYARYPGEEDRYWLFRRDARLTSCGLSACVDTEAPLPFSELRRRKARKAARAGLTVGRSEDWGTYWALLTETLETRHGVRPVHTLREITLLHSRFPEAITLHTVQDGDEMLGGCVVYNTGRVAHVQYIAANEAGRAAGALDLLFGEITAALRKGGPRYLDYGISTEAGGRVLNEGLLFQKEGFGGRGVTYECYEIKL